jgi:hypothetical protein
MPANADRQRFRNEDLLLKVSPAVDRSTWDESRYEAFIDELCEDREYQKEAIRVTLRYLLGSNYAKPRDPEKNPQKTLDSPHRKSLPRDGGEDKGEGGSE